MLYFLLCTMWNTQGIPTCILKTCGFITGQQIGCSILALTYSASVVGREGSKDIQGLNRNLKSQLATFSIKFRNFNAKQIHR